MSVRISITGGGIYDGEGREVPIGTELSVSEEPSGWAGRYTVLGKSDGKVAVTSPAEGALPAAEPPAGPKGPFTVKDDGAGWHGVYDADDQKVKSLRKDDAEAFAGLSADDQLAFLTEA